VPKTVEKFVPEVGNIERVWASVLIDGEYEESKNQDGTVARNYVERTPQELAKFQALVAGAIGIDPTRNDELSVLSFQFTQPETELTEPTGNGFVTLLPKILEKLVLGIIIVLIFLLAKSLITRLSERVPALPGGQTTAAALAGGQGGASGQALTTRGDQTKLAGSAARGELAQGSGSGAHSGPPGGEPTVIEDADGGPKVVFRRKDQTVVLDEEGPSVETLKYRELLKRTTKYIEDNPENAAQIMRSWIVDDVN
jgi:flagellar biosynthesis/type III secretory pathway M-ring protein FliF/YscJ